MSGLQCTKRIGKEFAALQEHPPQGMKVDLKDDPDLMVWIITVDGPSTTPYKGGKFKLRLTFPTDYPFKPPTFNWDTKIYHPNVTNDAKGNMCLGILKPSEWKPSSKIDNALEFVRQLLIEPDIENAIEAEIAGKYTENRAAFNTEAATWTKKYAK